MDRRTFIRAAGSLALAGVTSQLAPAADDARTARSRVLVLDEPGFPAGEIELPAHDALGAALSACDVTFAPITAFRERLAAGTVDVAVTPYGSRFPKELFEPLMAHLSRGGNWVNVGGVPLGTPVVREDGSWRAEAATTAYHERLGVAQSFPVDGAGLTYRSPGFRKEPRFTAVEVQELYVCFTATKDHPSEDGSGGPRDAALRPLVVGLGEGNEPLAAPIVLIDRLQGRFAGGRWIFASFRGTLSAAALAEMIALAGEGASELSAHMSFACYRDGEVPAVTVRFHRPGAEARERMVGPCELEVMDARHRVVAGLHLPLDGRGATATATATIRVGHLPPGLYELRATLPVRPAQGGTAVPHRVTTGFWVYDRALLEGGATFTAGEQYLLRDGVPYPVTGTTYMDADVHRKFLFEPNPALWDRDFAAMRQAGVNMVRTGVWTGWKNIMLDVGAPNEAALRAMDAFVLTARKNRIPLIITFFAFLPESWGGANAYLDPRSVAAQKEFVTLFTRRYAMCREIIWDLINEPSFCSADHLWQTRPNYDAFEASAWNAWLRRRYPAPAGAEVSRLQELYRAAADEAVALPALADFDDANIFGDRRPIKVIDYRLFAQESFAAWAADLAATIRANGHPAQLITVGQDEGGTYERPGNQFAAGAVDFTCLHNWWLNDHLLWDNVVTKAPGKVNLVEETGVMFYESMDGRAWRSEREVADLLDRKMALALGAGAAGFIEWIWNTNHYMPSENEAAIGFHRVDGTAKPELRAFRRYAAFMGEHRRRLTGRVEEDVLLVLAHSQMFSVRNFATEATQRCVRAMQYGCGVPMRAVSEYGLAAVTTPPRLILVPSARTLSSDAWVKLLALAETGATLLVTGPIDRDDHWMSVDRLGALGVAATAAPVMPEESLALGGTVLRLGYRSDKLQRLEKGVGDRSGVPTVAAIRRGRGTILWVPLPVELAEDPDPTVALYREALARAEVSAPVSPERPDPSVLVVPTIFHDTILVTAVSESDRATTVTLRHEASGTAVPLTVPPGRGTMLLLDRASGRILGAMD